VDNHRAFAVSLFDRTSELLDEPVRTPAQDREMLDVAFGSHFHWSVIGDETNFAVGDCQLARVLAATGHSTLAQQYAELALRRAVDDELGPFLVGCGHEVLARVADGVGDTETRDSHIARADDLLSVIEDEQERDVLIRDLDLLRG